MNKKQKVLYVDHDYDPTGIMRGSSKDPNKGLKTMISTAFKPRMSTRMSNGSLWSTII